MLDVIFNGEGPIMQGTWYNPTNGDSFTVADSFFQDNQYIVKTTDGRMLDYNFIQNYVKSDAPIQKQTKSPAHNNELPTEVASLIEGNFDDIMTNDDMNMLNKPMGNIYTPAANTTNMAFQNNTNASIIEKALSKRDLPNVTTKILWKQFPQKEIDMLIDLMDVSLDEIIEWYVSRIDVDEIKRKLQIDIKMFVKDACKVGQSGVEEIKPKAVSKPKNKPKKK